MIRGFGYQRCLHTASILLAKSSQSAGDADLVLQAARKAQRPKNSALFAYRYFEQLKQSKNPILTEEYKQLPDDSQFIDKHYVELVKYRDLICGVGGKYDDLGDVSELFLRLSNQRPKCAGSELQERHPIYQLQVEQFDQFVEDLMHTMRLTGGHLFILDLLIYNRQVFDHCETTNHKL